MLVVAFRRDVVERSVGNEHVGPVQAPEQVHWRPVTKSSTQPGDFVCPFTHGEFAHVGSVCVSV